MNSIITIAVLTCACAVFCARNDLVYRRPKSPDWLSQGRGDKIKESEPFSSVEKAPLVLDRLDSEASASVDIRVSEVTLKDGSLNGKNKIPKIHSKGGYGKITPDENELSSSPSESREGPSYSYGSSDYDRPRHTNKDKKRITTKKRQPKRPNHPRNSYSDERGAPIIDLDSTEDDHSDVALPTGKAPAYHEALENFDAASDIIQSHFKREAFTYEENRDFRFVIIAVVVDGLSKIVAENGWEEYDVNYRNIVKTLAEKATTKPMESVDLIRCVFKKAHNKIQKIRNIINNKWTKAICKSQPAACNAVIYAQIKSSPNSDKNLDNKAHILIKLGESATTYLSYYASVFEAVSYLNAYQYLATGKEVIRNLVRKNAEVRNLLFPNGGPAADECGVNSNY